MEPSVPAWWQLLAPGSNSLVHGDAFRTSEMVSWSERVPVSCRGVFPWRPAPYLACRREEFAVGECLGVT